eukprot:NODE_6560_length_523_cov_6.654040_g6395_i0.p1 GENE.NODE_6560_length_523_cov_6.654040_g6395_i0~~NODE_6560_length_523_cov_6.654040_g6395_i0.p1  ORF type:complete len:129 (-),score=14.22 NODE_6560_length_523_cov_6.654040_g6395_i0:137-523(-)
MWRRGILTCGRSFSTAQKVQLFVTTQKGERLTFSAEVGQSVMEICRDNNLEMEAACDGTCACSTCHVYIKEGDLARVPPASEDELDMLDLALGLKDNSRLACQIKLTPELDGLEATLPDDCVNHLPPA